MTIAAYEARWLTGVPGGVLVGDRYRIAMQGGGVLELPLQALPDGRAAIALLMSNQTTFAVETAIGAVLAGLARAFRPEVIIGIPTLGLDYARLVARELGFDDYVALGFSRKFWYDDALSELATSITSPGAGKRLYLDPALRDRVAGRRVLLVDDVINTGGTAAAAIRLVTKAGGQVQGLVAALTEGHAWRRTLASLAPDWPARVASAGRIPMFRRAGPDWEPDPETL
ncbi:MAG: phosphoribosyltransferase [Burkholderiales bacterium]|nr:phosphoribosyltransferase [Burkholderiales bacterium]